MARQRKSTKAGNRGGGAVSPARTPRRKSARTKTADLPTKSPYFEQSSEEDKGDGEADDGEAEQSAFEGSVELADDQESEPSEPEEEAEEEYESLEFSKKRRRVISKIPRASAKSRTNSKSETGERVIALRAPSPGDTPYTPERIHPNTMEFLTDLKNNNDRNWLRENDGAYRAAKSDFDDFVERMTAVMIEEVDSTIPELPLKDVVFRIYRDIRFSNDRTPYKLCCLLPLVLLALLLTWTYVSAAWSRTGKKGPYAAYYISFQPGKSMVGGGLWHPPAQALELLRRDVDKNPTRFKKVLSKAEFAEEFFDRSTSNDEKAVIRAFAEHNKEDALKTAPKNYPKDHPDIELLRLRSFTISKRLTDSQVTAPDLVNRLKRIFKRIEPFISALNAVVMPDISGDESSDTGSDGDAAD